MSPLSIPAIPIMERSSDAGMTSAWQVARRLIFPSGVICLTDRQMARSDPAAQPAR